MGRRALSGGPAPPACAPLLGVAAPLWSSLCGLGLWRKASASYGRARGRRGAPRRSRFEAERASRVVPCARVRARTNCAAGEFTPGKIGEWRFDKRSYGGRPIPRHLGDPPKGMKNDLVRALINSFNEATEAIPCWDEFEKTGKVRAARGSDGAGCRHVTCCACCCRLLSDGRGCWRGEQQERTGRCCANGASFARADAQDVLGGAQALFGRGGGGQEGGGRQRGRRHGQGMTVARAAMRLTERRFDCDRPDLRRDLLKARQQ